jgi:hypothetical protein
MATDKGKEPGQEEQKKEITLASFLQETRRREERRRSASVKIWERKQLLCFSTSTV